MNKFLLKYLGTIGSIFTFWLEMILAAQRLWHGEIYLAAMDLMTMSIWAYIAYTFIESIINTNRIKRMEFFVNFMKKNNIGEKANDNNNA